MRVGRTGWTPLLGLLLFLLLPAPATGGPALVVTPGPLGWATQPEPRLMRVLAVGQDPDPEGAVSPESDVLEIAGLMKDEERADHHVEVVALLGAEATREALLAELARAEAELEPDDALVLLYAGPGHRDDAGSHLVLAGGTAEQCGAGTRRTRARPTGTRGPCLSTADLAEATAGIRAERQLFVLDAPGVGPPAGPDLPAPLRGTWIGTTHARRTAGVALGPEPRSWGLVSASVFAGVSGNADFNCDGQVTTAELAGHALSYSVGGVGTDADVRVAAAFALPLQFEPMERCRDTPPVVGLVSPDPGRAGRLPVDRSQTFEFVVFAADSAGIDQVTVAGVEAERRGRSDHYTASVEVRSGPRVIEVVAVDWEGIETRQVYTFDFKLDPTTAEVGLSGRARALLIATDEYEGWSDLANPVHDAEVLQGVLAERYGFEVELLRNPTAQQLFERLDEYRRMELGPDDRLFVFVAGHGHYREEEDTGFIVTADSDPLAEDPFGRSMIEARRFVRTVEQLSAGHVLISLDICFGGSFFSERRYRGSGSPYRDLDPGAWVERKLDLRTRQWITSGNKEPVPDGYEGFHSPFAHRLIDTLRRGGGDDGLLTMSELAAALEMVEPGPVWGNLDSAEPGSEFFFLER